jgi:hypothetical protein
VHTEGDWDAALQEPRAGQRLPISFHQQASSAKRERPPCMRVVIGIKAKRWNSPVRVVGDADEIAPAS